MFVVDTITRRLKRGCETMAYPRGAGPALPDRYVGALEVDVTRCVELCTQCIPVCPTAAITRPRPGAVELDMGRCTFCAACVETCPEKAIRMTAEHRQAVRRRSDLVVGGAAGERLRSAEALGEELRTLLGRSLKLRQVSAGGCNACEADTNVLGTVGWDVGRFGIQFVASPRHADGLLITGPVTKGMELALRKTWEAVPEPRIVIAVGACAISGGPFVGHREVNQGADTVVPVDLYVPGCPPHPLTILDGILRLLGRVGAT